MRLRRAFVISSNSGASRRAFVTPAARSLTVEHGSRAKAYWNCRAKTIRSIPVPVRAFLLAIRPSTGFPFATISLDKARSSMSVGVGTCYADAGSGTAGRTDRAEEIGRLEAMITHGARSTATWRPTPGQDAALADEGFVPEAGLHSARLRVVFAMAARWSAKFFLNASWAATSILGWIGRGVRKDRFI